MPDSLSENQSGSRQLRILYVGTRYPLPANAGRKVMILQSLDFSRRLGEVHFAYCGSAPATDTAIEKYGLAGVHFIKNPSISEVLSSLLSDPFKPLQSHLVGGKKSKTALLSLVEEIRPDVVIFDMLRTGSLARFLRKNAPKLPIVLDLDDLLSERYVRMIAGKNTEVLSLYGQNLPSAIRWVGGIFPAIFLRLEAALMRRYENSVVDTYDGLLAISGKEAGILKSRIQPPAEFAIQNLPPVVHIAEGYETSSTTSQNPNEIRFVFIGNAVFGPNAIALEEFDRLAKKVSARLPAGKSASFHAVGQINPKLVLNNLQVHGFVDNLAEFLAGTTVMVAPLRTGTGIKLKMLDAFASGVPVVTNDIGVESLDLEPQTHFIRATDEDDFEEKLLEIASGQTDYPRLKEIGMAAQEYMRLKCSDDVVFGRFRNVVEQAIKFRSARS